MASFNKVILMGNLTRDPEIRQAPSGTKVADLGLAVSETWRDKATGQPREVTCFVDVVVWDKLAELCGQYLAKGRPILVEGRLQMDEWKNPQGEKRTKLRVRADTIKFVGPAPQRQGEAAASHPASSSAMPSAPAPSASVGMDAGGDLAQDDEQLPF